MTSLPAAPRELDPSLYDLDEDTVAFFKKLTGFDDAEDLKRHILEVQAAAYEEFPYPCIFGFGFAKLSVTRLPVFPDIVKLGKERKDAIFVDIGCCFGSDVRRVVASGWPVKGCIASDLRPAFWRLGHRMFRTTPETFPVPFVGGSIFDDKMLSVVPPLSQGQVPSTPRPGLHELGHQDTLNPLHGHASVIHASNFFHLFTEEQQAHVARAFAGLLSAEPGSMIVGHHGALPEKGVRPGLDFLPEVFCHGPQSWRELWEGIFGKGKVKVEAEVSVLTSEQTHLYKIIGNSIPWYLMRWSVVRL